MRHCNLGAIMLLALTAAAHSAQAGQTPPATPTNPILFVTQVPVPADFNTIASVFGNHLSDPSVAARGGDLYILYPDGTLKNLTKTAGFGSATAQQDAQSIAVREPAVHWSGTKALFSMVIGAPLHQFDISFNGFWQIYEITGLGENETPAIVKVANQPANFNNVSPCYGTDERIIFTSDQPRNGAAYLYPQRDEYEFAPSITGLWSLNPTTGDLFLMSHDPSGSFSPTIDSYGRVIFTRWDHLQRDQEADADALSTSGTVYGTMNFADETANAAQLPRQEEFFPEPREERTDLLAGTDIVGHTFNQFFPWMVNEDGTGEETINHVGRHELFDYMALSFNDDPNLQYFSPSANRVNKNRIDNMLQIKEDPLNPGTYYGIDCPEFSTHAAGQIVTLYGPAGIDADLMYVTYKTPRSTQGYNLDGTAPDPTSTGHYRNPTPLSDGLLIAVHAPETRADNNDGTTQDPTTRYAFQIKTIVAAGPFVTAGQSLTGGINKAVTYWSPDVLVSYSGPLWELDPVEVIVRTKPVAANAPLAAPEQNVFDEEGVDTAAFKGYLASNNLAIIVSRNLTTRDQADKQQPFNLRIAGTTTETIPVSGKIYDISHLQLFQADQLRGYTGGSSTVRPGRRVLATPMHDAAGYNPADPTGPAGSVQLGTDGSMAAFVPAQRAMTWQTTATDGTPVVRERYWLSFQPGEIRSCTSCHGINTVDQANQPAPTERAAGPAHAAASLQSRHLAQPGAGVHQRSDRAAESRDNGPKRITFTGDGHSGTGTLNFAWNFGDGLFAGRDVVRSVSHTLQRSPGRIPRHVPSDRRQRKIRRFQRLGHGQRRQSGRRKSGRAHRSARRSASRFPSRRKRHVRADRQRAAPGQLQSHSKDGHNRAGIVQRAGDAERLARQHRAGAESESKINEGREYAERQYHVECHRRTEESGTRNSAERDRIHERKSGARRSHDAARDADLQRHGFPRGCFNCSTEPRLEKREWGL